MPKIKQSGKNSMKIRNSLCCLNLLTPLPFLALYSKFEFAFDEKFSLFGELDKLFTFRSLTSAILDEHIFLIIFPSNPLRF